MRQRTCAKSTLLAFQAPENEFLIPQMTIFLGLDSYQMG